MPKTTTALHFTKYDALAQCALGYLGIHCTLDQACIRYHQRFGY